MIRLVTFATEDMSASLRLCMESASRHGVNETHFYMPQPIGLEYAKYIKLRGFGYWKWKPGIIDQRMRVCTNGDVLIYSDAGVEFIAPVSHIIERMDQDIFLFGNNWEHAHWCKRDVVEAVWPTFANAPMDRPWNAVANSATWERFGKQVQASVIFFRVSDYARQFVAEWLKWCLFEGGRLIDDSPSRLPNHPEFREHRHDQAILTTMAYREGIKLHYWPAMYNDGAFTYEKLPEYAGDDYPVLVHHHRRRNADWEQSERAAYNRRVLRGFQHDTDQCA